ncbi:MAG: hypothetical protein AAGE52_17450, partial [Myxococcota bacterium]
MARLLVALLVLGCGSSPDEEGPAVDVRIEADGCIQAQTQAIELVVEDEDGEVVGVFRRESNVFPVGVRVLARSESRSFRVKVTAFGTGELPIAHTEVAGAFPELGLTETRAVLDDACFGHICAEACVDARCVPAEQAADRAPNEGEMCPAHLFVRAGESGDCTFEAPCGEI